MKIPRLPKHLNLPFAMSVLLHIAIVVFVFAVFSIPTEVKNISTQAASSAPQQPIVQAVAVNQADVQKEMQRIQQQATARKAAQAAEQQKIAQQKAQLRDQQQRAATAMAALKAQQAALAKAEQAQQQAQQQKIAKQQAALKQQQAEQALQAQAAAEQQAINAARAKHVASIVDKYNAMILNAIYPHFIVNPKQKDLSADVLINVAPDGSVLNVSIQQSSGSPAFDRAAVSAVYQSSPLPVPKDPQAFAVFKQFKLTLKPVNIVNNGGQ